MSQRVSFHPLSAGEVMGQTFEAYRKLFRPILVLVGVIMVPVIAIGAVVLGLLFGPIIHDFHTVTLANGGTKIEYLGVAPLAGRWVAAGVVFVLLLFAQLLLQTSATALVGQAYVGADTRWQTALAMAFRRIGRLVLTLLVVWIPTLVVVGIIIGIGALAGPAGAVIALVLVGVGACWYLLACSLVIAVVLFEGTWGAHALGRSIQLIRGRWWPTLGCYLVMSIAAGVASEVANVADRAAFGGPVGLAIAVIAVVYVAEQVVTPIPVITLAFCFFDLANRKGGIDVASTAARLGVEPGPLPQQTMPGPQWGQPGYGGVWGWGPPGYPSQPGYPPQQQGYPPHPPGYPTQPGYPPQQPGYPPPGPGYPPTQPGYPPGGGYQPPTQPGYPPGGGYPPPTQPGHSQPSGYPPAQPGYPPQAPPTPPAPSYPPQQPTYPTPPAPLPGSQPPTAPQPPTGPPSPPPSTWPAISPKPSAPRSSEPRLPPRPAVEEHAEDDEQGS